MQLLDSFDSAIRTFFNQLTNALGFMGYLILFLGVEFLFLMIYLIKSAFSYETRLKKHLNKLNAWLFKNKKIDENNIAEFNRMIKRAPKRLKFHWQQYILYREDAPSKYLNEANIVEKPLKTSSYKSSIKNLGLLTLVWGFIASIFGIASQINTTLSVQSIAVGLVPAAGVALLGTLTILILKTKRVLNLDDLYHAYHLFARFLDNACADLNPYIDFDLLFTPKEIEKGNAQLRQYYEARARKAKEEFDKANAQEEKFQDYKFEDVGVDGSLLLNRALKESEIYINKKTKTLSQIAQVETQKDALRRNYENVQMDLQRKIQASKENIKKLIEQQAATTSRMEVGLLRQQQEKEVAKQDSLQRDYDQEEQRYNIAKKELDEEIEELNLSLNDGLEQVTSSMASEYQSFYEKIMKSAYKVAEKKVKDEKIELNNKIEQGEDELSNVQTQIKRLKDENDYLRSLLEEKNVDVTAAPEGHYDENGNYIYADGSYHDTEGLFHDVDGKIYNMNGELVSVEETEEQKLAREKEEIKEDQTNQFGTFVSPYSEEKQEESISEPAIEKEENQTEPVIEEQAPAKRRGRPRKEVKEKPEQTEPKKKPGRPRKEKTQEIEEPKRKVGRPRKEVSEKEELPAKKPGRPRKENAEEKVEPKKKPGRPRKETKEETEEKKKPGRPKKEKAEPKKRKTRGRPRKVVDKTRVNEEEPKRRVGRPKKEGKQDINDLNELINLEEEKLANLENITSSELNSAFENNGDIDKQRDEILAAVEELRAKASQSGQSQEELASINARLETLIGKLSNLK